MSKETDAMPLHSIVVMGPMESLRSRSWCSFLRGCQVMVN